MLIKVWLHIWEFSPVRIVPSRIYHPMCDLGERFTSRFGKGAGLHMEALKHAKTLCYGTLHLPAVFHSFL